MKNKKGFTLIELLAIISILAIILLIAVPAISNVIETSRKNAFKDTALSVIKAAEFSYDLKKLENNVIEDITIDLGDKNDPNRGLIDLKGEYPSGTVVIKDTGVVKVNITNGYFCATGTRDDLEIKKGDCEEDFPIVVSNADDECFIVAGDSINAYIGMEGYNCPTDLIIPSILNGTRIKSISSLVNPYYYSVSLTSLTIPEGVTRIESVPSGSLNVNGPLYLPNSLEYIGDIALSTNFNFNVTYENGFKYLKNSDGTTNKNIILSYEGTDTNLVIPKETKIILENAFNNKQLESVDFSKATNLKQIGPNAFANNLLTNVEIPDSIMYLAVDAFTENNLNGINIPSTLKTFTSFNYNNNESIRDLSLHYKDESTDFVYLKKTDGTPDKRFLISYEGESKNIEIDENVTQILTYALLGKDLESIKLPDGLISIGGNAIGGNNLKSITIPNSVTTIDSTAFFYNQLTHVVIPKNVTYIGVSAFAGNNMESVVLGDSVKFIGGDAFSMNQLTNIIIPSSVTYIGERVFSGNNIDELTINGNCNRFDSILNYYNVFGESKPSITCGSK